MNRNIIDISRHQHTFDAGKARAAGVDGVIIRNAYAAKPDTLALSWAPSILAQGMPLGGYGFATWHYKSQSGGSVDTARALMRQQVSVWIETAKQSGCNYWFGVDQELEAGETMGLGKAPNTALLNEACEMLEKAGLHACVYCSVAWDSNYIRTADLHYPYWLARYVDGKADFGSAGADLDRLPDGKYTRWMRQLRDAGRLAGWQFASTGYGAKYGAGSANIDRNVFYLAPAADRPAMGQVPPQKEALYIAIGPLSTGDLATVKAQLDKLRVDARSENGVIYTDTALSTGDQVAMIQLATKLQVPIRMQAVPFTVHLLADPETPAARYRVVYLAAVVKGGFETQADAVEYVEAVLGKDAMERLGISVAKNQPVG